ncbi:alpha/beta hydrolase [bacterium]|nr:alpha/beta hydrolase [bacterium]
MDRNKSQPVSALLRYVLKQNSRWHRRWAWLLAAALVLTWLPAVVDLIRESLIMLAGNRQELAWIPAVVVADRDSWSYPLMSLVYDLGFFAPSLRRMLGIMVGLGLAYALLTHLARQDGGPAGLYAAVRGSVRRAVYFWMAALFYVPSVITLLVHYLGPATTVLTIGQLLFPWLLLTADCVSLCEFQQWLILRHRGRRYVWYLGWTAGLAGFYMLANYYLPQTHHWGQLHLFAAYPYVLEAAIALFSLVTAGIWWRLARWPHVSFAGLYDGLPAMPPESISGPADVAAKGWRKTQAFLASRWPQVLAWGGLGLAALAIGWLAVLRSGVLVNPDCYPSPDLSIPVISTRGHCRAGWLVDENDTTGYEIVGSIPGLTADQPAPADIVIVIHGFNNPPDKALYKFDLAQSSLRNAGFTGQVVGFSWDADTQHDPIGITGFHTGDRHAALNGAKLAQFAVDWKRRNPHTRLHVIGYSMGCRMALECLWQLTDEPRFNNTGVKIDTVHLLGASLDNEVVECGERYGEAIETACGEFFNYYSGKDTALGAFYWVKEADKSLGEVCIEHPEHAPANYHSVDASGELCTYDQEYHLVAEKQGHNHKGYLGNKDPAGRLLDDGALNLVAGNIARQQSTAVIGLSRDAEESNVHSRPDGG